MVVTMDMDGGAWSVDGAAALQGVELNTAYNVGGDWTGPVEVDAAAMHNVSSDGWYDSAVVERPRFVWDSSTPQPSRWWVKGVEEIRHGRWWGKHVALVVMVMETLRSCVKLASTLSDDCELRQGGGEMARTITATSCRRRQLNSRWLRTHLEDGRSSAGGGARGRTRASSAAHWLAVGWDVGSDREAEEEEEKEEEEEVRTGAGNIIFTTSSAATAATAAAAGAQTAATTKAKVVNATLTKQCGAETNGGGLDDDDGDEEEDDGVGDGDCDGDGDGDGQGEGGLHMDVVEAHDGRVVSLGDSLDGPQLRPHGETMVWPCRYSAFSK